MYKILRAYTKEIEYELVADVQDISIVRKHFKECPRFIPFYLPRIDKENFPYKYHVLIPEIDYARKSICVKSSTAFPFWWLICKAEELSYQFQSHIYFFLKDKLNQGVNFVPPNQLMGNCFDMIGHFIKFKTRR